MKDLLVIALAIIEVFARFSESQAAEPLTVIDFSQPPNYALCTDIDDTRQLTDGKLAPFPIWTSKQTVGWAAVTPVVLQLRIVGKSSVLAPHAGTLRLHSAKGLSAGVDVPRQIDVYTRDSTNTLRQVGSLTSESEQLRDKDTHWLEVKITAATDILIIVVHAAGDYLFLDEIEWNPSGIRQIPAESFSITNVRAALDQSTRRTHAGLVKTAEAESKKLALRLDSKAMYAWIQDPWGAIDPGRAQEHLTLVPPTVEIQGYTGERESICIGIAVGEEVATSGLHATLNGLPKNSAKMYEVRPVVAANGQRVYDPLVPLPTDGRLILQSGVPIYIWLDVNLAILGPGTHHFDIHIEGNRREISLRGKASVAAHNSTGIKPLRAINWAYLSDKPVFLNKDKAIHDLLDHGINVFVAHPTEIPGLALDGTWSDTKAIQLTETVNVAKQHGMLLLYLGWNADKNPLGFSTKEYTLDPAARDRLLTWVGRLSAYLTANGLPQDRWALYPVDEPNLPSLQLINAVAEAVKQWNPLIRVYADPSLHPSLPIQTTDLMKLDKAIDYWQPNLMAVRGSMGSFFKSLRKEWWIYSNPKSPAKLGSPLHDYRMLAWWAWQYGASGVGFWSYSDTGGSSAWVDIDGQRPDWAVVYESEQGIISSRRWEAFREGLEDYALLSTHSIDETKKALGETSSLDLHRWTSNDIEIVRRFLLRNSSKP